MRSEDAQMCTGARENEMESLLQNNYGWRSRLYVWQEGAGGRGVVTAGNSIYKTFILNNFQLI
jgi:hypothetical protein